MSHQFTIEEITAILLDEHQDRMSGSIPPKALNKILYFAADDLERAGVDADIPYFWYMWGTSLATANTGIYKRETKRGNRIACQTSVNDIQAQRHEIRNVREILTGNLQHYYANRLEGITDEMYKEAPYEVQRVFREFDKLLEVATDKEQATLFGDNNQNESRRAMLQFVKEFPTENYPKFENDLFIWYRLMSAEINADEFDPDETQRIAKAFWRMFCLELARRENNDVSQADIEAELDINDTDSEIESMRRELHAKERDMARQDARGTEMAQKAAEAIVVPHLNINLEV
jgi:hypothetical protein